MKETRFTLGSTDDDYTSESPQCVVRRHQNVYCAAVLAAKTSMRGVDVKHVRRKDIDLEKVWDVESGTAKGVLYVGYSKNE